MYEVRDVVEVSKSSSAVLVVDMQNDFVHPEGALFVPEAPKTISHIADLIKRARGAGVKVFYTQDWHSEDDPEFKIWGRHAVAGTWGAEIVDDLKPLEGDVVIKKLRYDAFYGTPLDHLLKLHGIRTLVITGTVANICVLHTAGSAALRWYDVVIPMDCTSALSEEDYNFALHQVDFLYKGKVVKSQKGVKFV